MKIKYTLRDRIFVTVSYILLTLAFLAVLYPLLFMLSASVSDPIYVNQGEVILFPKGFSLDGYQRVLAYKPVWLGYRNTIFYTLTGTTISLIVTFTCAYSLSRKDLVGRKFLMMVIMLTMFFNGGLIPTYLVVRDLNLINKVWSVLLLGATSAWYIIVTRTFMETGIPDGILEAATIDGFSDFRIFTAIVLPLSMPIIAVMALFFGVGRWNSYFTEMIYLSDFNLYPLQLYLREVLIKNQISEVLMSEDAEAAAEQARVAEVMKYALIVVSTLPIMCLYPALQKYFIKGVMVGALKG